MIFRNTEVFNFRGALHGMRNPANYWDKSDSGICKGGDSGIGCINCSEYDCEHTFDYSFKIGKNDLEVAQSLIKAGINHSEFMKQIIVSVQITAPIYWWNEFDAYEVIAITNSTITMHKLKFTEITPDCFVFDGVIEMFNGTDMKVYEVICNLLENYRQEYLRTENERVWRALIQLLPSSWLQTRSVAMSYQNIRTISFAKENNKLTEWSKDFVKWRNSLPYSKELIMYRGEVNE